MQSFRALLQEAVPTQEFATATTDHINKKILVIEYSEEWIDEFERLLSDSSISNKEINRRILAPFKMIAKSRKNGGHFMVNGHMVARRFDQKRQYIRNEWQLC